MKGECVDRIIQGRYGMTNVTHLLWIGRWIEVVKKSAGWQFKSGRDAADWLLHPDGTFGGGCDDC